MPGGTQLQRLQQVPQALWQRRGRDDKRHLAAHAPLQSEINYYHQHIKNLYT